MQCFLLYPLSKRATALLNLSFWQAVFEFVEMLPVRNGDNQSSRQPNQCFSS